MLPSSLPALTTGLLALAAPLASGNSTVTFDSGTEGWSSIGFIEPAGGNPGARLRLVNPDTFGVTIGTTTNSDFVFDYTSVASATLGIDLSVDQIDFFMSPVSRPWLVELRDYDSPPAGFPYVSVWFKFADVSAAVHGNWTSFDVTIADTSAAALPAGWGGTGAETGLGEPILPPGRTFASVLAGVDEVVFTTFEPGFFFGFTAFDISVDNISITTVPIGQPIPTLPEWGLLTLVVVVGALGARQVARRNVCA